MNISINPTYLCNLRCDFCYLTPDQLSDTKRIAIERLDELLSQVDHIEHIDLYGGEISALPVDYQYDLLNTIRKYYSGTVNVNTNLIRVSPLLTEPDVFTSVSFDGPARDRWDVTLSNLAVLPVDVAVLILCSPKVLEFGAQMMMEIMRGFRNIISVEIKPYSANQSNDLNVDYTQFEDYVKEWLAQRTQNSFHFNFQNEDRMLNVLYGGYHAWSDNHVYITPNGKFAVLEFDMNDREYFLELDNLQLFREWSAVEQNRVVNNSYCSQCKFLGRCLTEHYREVKSLDKSCNGFFHLLEWYDEQKS